MEKEMKAAELVVELIKAGKMALNHPIAAKTLKLLDKTLPE